MQLSPSIFKAYDIRGVVPSTLDEAVAEGLGRAFQLTNLFPNLTVLENVRLAVQALHPAGGSFHRLPIEQQNGGLVTSNAFWKDYADSQPVQNPNVDAAKNPGPPPFFSKHIAEASRNFTRKGWESFTQALQRSRIIEMVETNQQVVTAAPAGAA